MVSSIYTFALIKALYDEGEDYIDSFWPIVVKTIPSNQSVTSSFVQTKLRQNYDLEMPLHVLEVILTRAETKKHLRQWRDTPRAAKKYRLTSSGINYSARLETDKEVERRMNALLESMQLFFEGKGVSLSSDEIRELLLHFVHRNTDFLIECINPSINLNELAPPKLTGWDRHLLEYVKYVEKQEPDDYKTLENIVFGSIISVLLYVSNPEEITEIRTKPFSHCQIFLDTNFVFSLLGLHTEEFNEPAKQLFNQLKKHDFKLKVFSFTIDEICRVINSFSEESYRYPTNIRVNTLYSSLKTKGWSKTDAREFIIDIEQKLQDKEITVEWMKVVDLSKYKPNEKLVEDIKKYKPDQGKFNRNHDLVAIAEIRELRKKTIRRIEDSEALFLTSDYRLSRFNFQEEGHKKNATICETVLDRLMMNILWLKNPNIKLSLNTIIAAHSRGLFVNRRVWDRFYEVLQKLKGEGRIGDDNIATLFWHSYLEDTLRSVEETETDKITPEFVLEEIEIAEKLRAEAIRKQMEGIEKEKEKEMEIKLRRKEEEFSEALKRTISDTESRKEEEWLNRIRHSKEKIRRTSVDSAGRWTNLIIILFALAFVVVVIIAYFSMPYNILDLILTLSGTGGILGFLKLRSKMKSKLSRYLYKKKLVEAELDKIA